MKSYVIHILRAMPSQGTLEGRYVGRAQSPLPMGAVSELAGLKREYRYPEGELYCASPAVSCVDTLKILYPKAEPEVVLELAECDFGDWENRTAEELKNEPGFKEWLMGRGAPPNGESGQVFFRRVCGGFQMLVKNMMARGCASAVLVTHAGVMTSILAAFGLPKGEPQDWLCDPGFGYSLRITPILWMREPVAEVFARVPEGKEGKI